MKLRSVNVGQPRENSWKAMKLTGIDKRPVAGPTGRSTPTPGRTWISLDREFKEIAGRRSA